MILFLVFEQEEDASSRSFFSEIISSISDVRFSNDGRYIVSRDYLTVKIWDVNMERQPVKTIPIHEHLRPRLCDTYENDSIFDKFEVVFSGDAENVMTGSYNNNFMIYPTEEAKDTEIVLQADKSAFKAKKVGVPTPMGKGNGKKAGSRSGSPASPGSRMKKETDADQIDFNKKILHMSWHPFEDSIAIAATNNVSCIPLCLVVWILMLISYAALCFLCPLNARPGRNRILPPSVSPFLLFLFHGQAHLGDGMRWLVEGIDGSRERTVENSKTKIMAIAASPRFRNPRISLHGFALGSGAGSIRHSELRDHPMLPSPHLPPLVLYAA